MGDMNFDGYQRLIQFFKNNRVSRRKLPISISVGKVPYYMYLTGMGLGDVDKDFHILPFLLHGTLLDLENEDASKINPASLVLTSESLDDEDTLTQALSVRDAEPPVFAEDSADIDAPVYANGENTNTDLLSATPSGRSGDPAASIARKKAMGVELTDEEMELDSVNTRIRERIKAKDWEGAHRIDEQTKQRRGELKDSIRNRNNGGKPTTTSDADFNQMTQERDERIQRQQDEINRSFPLGKL
jgi:hypothetical protein